MAPDQFERSEPRHSAINLVTIQLLDENGVAIDSGVGRTLDLSQHGMLLELDHSLPTERVANLSFALGDVVVDVDAEIRSAKETEDGNYAMGLKFTNLSAEATSAIEAYLQRRA